jgi:dihydrofolate reductase
MSLDMDIVIVAAVSKNGVIGKDGTIPWSIPTDLKHFKKLTEGGVVIMGRKTFESMGNKPLPKRHNIVVSTTMSKINLHSNLSIVTSLDEALWEAQEDFKEAFVIGGEAIYKEAMSLASKMIISHVDTAVKGGTARFPYINTKTGWYEDSRVKAEVNSRDDYDYAIVTYKRLVEKQVSLYATTSSFLPVSSFISSGTTTFSIPDGGVYSVGVGTSSISGALPTYSSFDSELSSPATDEDKRRNEDI